mmetsp:Transcript_11944/g.26020  ORF Transcript_11944/g.26020 Transcript_11944/m.26020 type:complete len:338 (+) Transcript_11944:514-1527(+)
MQAASHGNQQLSQLLGGTVGISTSHLVLDRVLSQHRDSHRKLWVERVLERTTSLNEAREPRLVRNDSAPERSVPTRRLESVTHLRAGHDLLLGHTWGANIVARDRLGRSTNVRWALFLRLFSCGLARLVAVETKHGTEQDRANQENGSNPARRVRNVNIRLHDGNKHEPVHRHQLDQDVHRRTRSILERITNGITSNCRLVPLRPLRIAAPKEARLNKLLRIVPRTTSVRHHDTHHVSRPDATEQKTNKRFLPKPKPNDERRHDRNSSRNHHFNNGRLCGDRHAFHMLGAHSRTPFAQTRDLAELPPNLHNHCLGRPAHAEHCERPKQVRKHNPKEQ